MIYFAICIEKHFDGGSLERGKECMEAGGTEAHKLDLTGRLMAKKCEGRGMMVKGRTRRRRFVKLRGGTAELAVETGRC